MLPDLVAESKARWLEFSRTPAFDEPGPLKDKLTFFAMPAIRGLRENLPDLRDCSDQVLLHVIALGVVGSGTHTREQVEEALGRPLSQRNEQ